MNVLLLHLDGKIPNLALMRLHGYHAAQGDHVELREVLNAEQLQPRLGDLRWDRVYGSLIFERTRPLAEIARHLYPEVVLGGTGIDLTIKLPADVEATAPSYVGYPSYKASIGFAQRGCWFQCEFCVVPRKEGKVKPVATLAQIWRGGKRNIVLLDNDFFGNPNWQAIIAEAIAGNFALAVIQGINARLLSDKQAAAIASVRWMADDFSRRRVYTAWDLEDDEHAFFRGLNRLKAHGIKPRSILVYMLIGYRDGETHADRDHRRSAIRAFGAMPFPMPYVRTGELGDELRAFQGWCIQRKDEFVPWEKWWGKAKGSVRKLGTRRVSLPLFKDPDPTESVEPAVTPEEDDEEPS